MKNDRTMARSEALRCLRDHRGFKHVKNHIYIHTYLHTYIHTYIVTYTHAYFIKNLHIYYLHFFLYIVGAFRIKCGPSIKQTYSRPFLSDAATDDLMDVDVGEPCVRSKFEIFKVLDPIFHRRADLSIASDEGTNSNA